MDLAFLGTSEFALPTLEALAAAGHRLRAVVTRPDRPRGRSGSPRASPVAAWATARGLECLRPQDAGAPPVLERLAGLGVELAVVAAFGQRLSAAFLGLPARGAINVHASLLPRHRGASPVSAAILAGDPVTGVTVQEVVERMDAGPVLATRTTEVGAEETCGELTRRLAALGAELAVSVLARFDQHRARAEPQDESRATWARRLTKEDGRIDWSQDAPRIARTVRAYNPWPGARTPSPGGELTVLAARALDDADGSGGAPAPGTVVATHDGGLRVATGRGVLEVLRVHPAGRRPMEARAFLRGAPLRAGDLLGAMGLPGRGAS